MIIIFIVFVKIQRRASHHFLRTPFMCDRSSDRIHSCLWEYNISCPESRSLAPVPSLADFPKEQRNLKISARGNPGKELRVGVPSLSQGLLAVFVCVPWTSWKSGEACGPLLRVMFLNVSIIIHRISKRMNDIELQLSNVLKSKFML